MYDNIFSPSFGNRPRILVGREQVIREFQDGLRSQPGSKERATLLLGQRGSGKTVLLLEFTDLAQKSDYIVASPTIVARGMLDRILEKLNENGRNYLTKDRARLSGGNLSAMGFGAGVQFQEPSGEQKSFAFRLSQICRKLKEKGKGVLILIDEVQANNEELRQLIIAYQEMVGEQQNIALVMAGLPGAISSTLNDHVLTFLNRATKIKLDPLRINDVNAYYQQAFKTLDLNISDEMRRKAANETMGSPYLMQLIGHYITRYATDAGDIDRNSFSEALENARADFENDICHTAISGLSDTDIIFLESMAVDESTSRIADLVKRLEVSPAYAQLYKRRLKEAGIIEQVRRGEIQFAIPYLKEYLRKKQC